MKKIKNAIVGLGRIASLLEDDELREKPCTHAGAIAENPDCRLVGGCDSDPGRRKLFTERWNCPLVFGDIDKLLTKTKCDILHIATHPDSHYYYVKKAVQYQIPIVICEKPLADTFNKAVKIVQLVEKNSIKLLTNHERRYSFNYQHVKSIIAEKKYGNLLSIYSRLYMGKKKKIRDMLWHDGTHLIDIIHYLSGTRLKKPQVLGSLDNSRGTVIIAAKAGKVPVMLEIGAGRDHLVFELDLSFSRGRILIGNGIYQEYQSKESPYYEKFRSLNLVESNLPEKTGYFTNMLFDAVACFKDKKRLPVSSVQDGYEVIRFLNKL